jgi:hypothetical protein
VCSNFSSHFFIREVGKHKKPLELAESYPGMAFRFDYGQVETGGFHVKSGNLLSQKVTITPLNRGITATMKYQALL